ncbi:hypothetical protein Pelo_15679 [Pelomyxa schiedti]|nr:hypothetical protein Pelo_15679 [Pelomyxa schiedti]
MCFLRFVDQVTLPCIVAELRICFSSVQRLCRCLEMILLPQSNISYFQTLSLMVYVCTCSRHNRQERISSTDFLVRARIRSKQDSTIYPQTELTPHSWGGEPTAHGTDVDLCFSGGGIRSAVFCSGVLNGICSRKARPNNISCVSGGGFTGSLFQQYYDPGLTPDVIAGQVSDRLREKYAYLVRANGTGCKACGKGCLSVMEWTGWILLGLVFQLSFPIMQIVLFSPLTRWLIIKSNSAGTVIRNWLWLMILGLILCLCIIQLLLYAIFPTEQEESNQTTTLPAKQEEPKDADSLLDASFTDRQPSIQKGGYHSMQGQATKTTGSLKRCCTVGVIAFYFIHAIGALHVILVVLFTVDALNDFDNNSNSTSLAPANESSYTSPAPPNESSSSYETTNEPRHISREFFELLTAFGTIIAWIFLKSRPTLERKMQNILTSSPILGSKMHYMTPAGVPLNLPSSAANNWQGPTFISVLTSNGVVEKLDDSEPYSMVWSNQDGVLQDKWGGNLGFEPISQDALVAISSSALAYSIGKYNTGFGRIVLEVSGVGLGTWVRNSKISSCQLWCCRIFIGLFYGFVGGMAMWGSANKLWYGGDEKSPDTSENLDVNEVLVILASVLFCVYSALAFVPGIRKFLLVDPYHKFLWSTYNIHFVTRDLRDPQQPRTCKLSTHHSALKECTKALKCEFWPLTNRDVNKEFTQFLAGEFDVIHRHVWYEVEGQKELCGPQLLIYVKAKTLLPQERDVVLAGCCCNCCHRHGVCCWKCCCGKFATNDTVNQFFTEHQYNAYEGLGVYLGELLRLTDMSPRSRRDNRDFVDTSNVVSARRLYPKYLNML